MPVLNSTVIPDASIPAANAPNHPAFNDPQASFDTKLENFFNKNADLFPGEVAPTTDTPAPSTQTPSPSTQTPSAAATVPDETAERKALIAADKERRIAKQQAKTAKEKAEAYEAIQKAANSDNPEEVLKAAGIDPDKFYNKIVDFASKGSKDQTPPDPMEVKLQAYEKRAQEAEQRIQEREFELQVETALNQHAMPVITNNPDNYEILLALHNGDRRAVAKVVFERAAEIHMQTGKVVPLEQVANELEQNEWNKIEAGYNTVSKLKKFAAKYGVSPQSIPQQQATTPDKVVAVQSESQRQTPSVATQVPSTPRPFGYQPTQDERMMDALKRAGLPY